MIRWKQCHLSIASGLVLPEGKSRQDSKPHIVWKRIQSEKCFENCRQFFGQNGGLSYVLKNVSFQQLEHVSCDLEHEESSVTTATRPWLDVPRNVWNKLSGFLHWARLAGVGNVAVYSKLRNAVRKTFASVKAFGSTYEEYIVKKAHRAICQYTYSKWGLSCRIPRLKRVHVNSNLAL